MANENEFSDIQEVTRNYATEFREYRDYIAACMDLQEKEICMAKKENREPFVVKIKNFQDWSNGTDGNEST